MCRKERSERERESHARTVAVRLCWWRLNTRKGRVFLCPHTDALFCTLLLFLIHSFTLLIHSLLSHSLHHLSFKQHFQYGECINHQSTPGRSDPEPRDRWQLTWIPQTPDVSSCVATKLGTVTIGTRAVRLVTIRWNC